MSFKQKVQIRASVPAVRDYIRHKSVHGCDTELAEGFSEVFASIRQPIGT